jgi:hypothetical protein
MSAPTGSITRPAAWREAFYAARRVTTCPAAKSLTEIRKDFRQEISFSVDRSGFIGVRLRSFHRITILLR